MTHASTTPRPARRRHALPARAAALLGLTMLLALPASAVTSSELVGKWICDGYNGTLDIASGSGSNQLNFTWIMPPNPPGTCVSTFTSTATGATLSNCTLSFYNAKFNGVYVFDSIAKKWWLDMRWDWMDPGKADMAVSCTKLKTGS